MTTCQECGGSKCKLVSGEHIYPHRQDLYWKRFWVCTQCQDAYVGCHGETDRPLGTCAGPELRKMRRRCHDAFDPLWKCKVFPSRTQAYFWLGKLMGRTVHFSQMGITECNEELEFIKNRARYGCAAVNNMRPMC